MRKYYILAISYEGSWDINSDDIVCVGSKTKINSYIQCKYPKYFIEHNNIKKLYTEKYVEITAEIQLYLREHHTGYAVMAFVQEEVMNLNGTHKKMMPEKD